MRALLTVPSGPSVTWPTGDSAPHPFFITFHDKSGAHQAIAVMLTMLTMSRTHRAISGICLAFLIPACASEGNAPSGAGWQRQRGRHDRQCDWRDVRQFERRSRQSNRRDDRQFDRRNSRDFDERDDWQRDQRDDWQRDQRDGWQFDRRLDRRPGRGNRRRRNGDWRNGGKRERWSVRRDRRPSRKHRGWKHRRRRRTGEWLRGREGVAHRQSDRRGPVRGCSRQGRGTLGGLHSRSDLRRPTTTIQYLPTEEPCDQRVLPPHPGLGERSHRQSGAERAALCGRLRRQQMVWTVLADDESPRLARFRGDRLAQYHHLQGRPAAHDCRLGLATPAVGDSSSPYYHRLDTANIGQLGHSEGGMSTCMVASEPRYKALAAICGTRALTGVHTPMLFFCGGKDTRVECDGVREVFLTVKDQPAFFIDELNADHGSWVYSGSQGRLSFHGRRVVQGSPDGRHREPQVFLWPELHLLHRQPREGRAEQPDGPVGNRASA